MNLLLTLTLLSSVFCNCYASTWRGRHWRALFKDNKDVECGGMLTSSSGIITSPKYPENYPNQVTCVWNITVPGNKKLTIEFKDFEVEMSHRCEYDAVEVYEGNLDSTSRLVRMCGNERPQKLTPRAGPVLVTFFSDYSVQFKGFSLHYSTSGCDQILTAPSGEIASPNHPEQYPISMQCSYHIIAAEGKQIVLSFTAFDTEQPEDGSQCTFDYVEVLDGDSNDSPLLGRFCGVTAPSPLRSSGTHLLVRFVADSTISGDGFKASYYTEDSSGGDCQKNNGGCDHVCTNYPDGAKCSCNRGYVLESDATTCTDVDECLKNNAGCEDICVNTPGSFRCECRAGYELREDKISCLNINECAVENGDCEHMCSDTDGSFYCSCFRGSRLSADKKSCEDVNECDWPKNRHHCEHICRNMPGSYYCDCRPGFVLSANQRMCIDLDECLMGGNKCEQLCVNTPGSYHCQCRPGYSQHPVLQNKCVDINECEESLPDCHLCANEEGGYRCGCREGYHQSVNKTSCTDVDECADNNGGCLQACVNVGGSYECRCWDGYKSTENNTKCVDIDECAENDGAGPCSDTCTNTEGSFTCSCPEGFALLSDKTTCQDINECAVDNGGCRHQCINTPGNFTCGCYDGFQNLGDDGKDFVCKDIDECATGIHRCGDESTCVNTEGNYSCACLPGFKAEWFNCIDIDECQNTTLNKCSQECVNVPGSFYCACKDGFVLDEDKTTCLDVDECELALCGHQCVNSPGSFRCSCQEGFELKADKQTCQDINECETDNGGCQQICVNTNGSYYCQCVEGFELSGKACQDIDECSLGLACCQHECVNTHGGFQCLCAPGYALISGKCNCSDIDECQANNGGCEQTCTNIPGSYKCGCRPGFQADPTDLTKCLDIDECQIDNGGCSQMCNNTAGSFYCSCRPVFRLSSDGRTCDHCPTCENFETLINIIEDLQKQVESLQAWRAKSTSGCSYGTAYYKDGAAWKPTRCTSCVCEVGQVICYRNPRCNDTARDNPAVAGLTGGPSDGLEPVTSGTGEGIDVDQEGSSANPTSPSGPSDDQSTTESPTTEDIDTSTSTIPRTSLEDMLKEKEKELFSINRRLT